MAATELAGEPITAKLTEAPGNGAAIGGLKVTTENAWFAARPSGTEDVYKIYAESFRGPDHWSRCRPRRRRLWTPSSPEDACRATEPSASSNRHDGPALLLER